ncbi:dihydropteroate synthase [Marinibactrum halimedae]|uniref:Dihydropteroate synthase n=1 Tax=Marinibactrum halimedae TaxID=1444977 RepID=A0AA37T4Y7_9GAMM|nr:dihydropteroate synthase [Marinibactrum halimedae]MCD9459006.1 dihydropteroate synthase [Marinibactrum halimedae]GLS26864.1 dihydropteroate synthase [Marinibactrum halimedae]
MMLSFLQCGNKRLNLEHPVVMGILNVTPDSFSDGGQLINCAGRQVSVDRVLRKAEQMVADGALVLDVGGESTRPGASPVTTQEELERVVPVVKALVERFDVVISVDTSSPVVMSECIQVGAGLINDVRALSRDGAIEVVSNSQTPVCLMHMQGAPSSMQAHPVYDDVVQDVHRFLKTRVDQCVASGIGRDSIVIDVGFGFGKSLEHNIELLRRLDEFNRLGLPQLVGVSRKSMIAGITQRKSLTERLPGSLAVGMSALYKGAKILRVHDVKETVDMVKVFNVTR